MDGCSGGRGAGPYLVDGLRAEALPQLLLHRLSPSRPICCQMASHWTSNSHMPVIPSESLLSRAGGSVGARVLPPMHRLLLRQPGGEEGYSGRAIDCPKGRRQRRCRQPMWLIYWWPLTLCCLDGEGPG